jgi:hypothetical protein
VARWNESNQQATNDDVFKLAPETIVRVRGERHEDPVVGQDQAVDERGLKVNVEGALPKLEALHANVTQPRKDPGEDTIDKEGRKVVAGTSVKNYQSVTRKVYNEQRLDWYDYSQKPQDQPSMETTGQQAHYDEDIESPWKDSQVQELRRLLELYLDPYAAAVWSSFNNDEVEGLRAKLQEVLVY